MTKCYIVMKESWADFDIPVTSPLFVYLDKVQAEGEKNRMNNSRKQKDFNHGEWDFTYIVESAKFKG